MKVVAFSSRSALGSPPGFKSLEAMPTEAAGNQTREGLALRRGGPITNHHLGATREAAHALHPANCTNLTLQASFGWAPAAAKRVSPPPSSSSKQTIV